MYQIEELCVKYKEYEPQDAAGYYVEIKTQIAGEEFVLSRSLQWTMEI